MKTTLWTGLALGVALLIAGCGKAQTDQPVPPVTEPRAETTVPADSAPQPPAETEPAAAAKPADQQPATEGAGVAGGGEMGAPVEKAEAEESGEAPPADKPTVLKAVGRALFKSFTSESNRSAPSDAPGFRPNR